MRSKLKIFILLLSFSILANFYTQTKQLRFEHLTIEDGLPENSGVVIYQDHLGFIWIGTYAGLVKYDGYQFVPYKSNQQNAGNDGVLAIEEDDEGMLWLGTMSGLKKFNPMTKDFLNYDFPDSINKVYKNLPFLHFSHDKKLWFINSSNFNLYRFDVKTNELRNFGPSGKTVNKINSPVTNWNYLKLWQMSFTEDNNGNIWIGTESTGLYKYIPEKDTLINYRNESNELSSLGSNKVFEIFQDSQGNIWIGTDGGGLNLYNNETNTFKKYSHINSQINSLINNSVMSIYEDRKGFLWLSTPAGLDRFDPEKNDFIHFTNDANDDKSISTNLATPIYEDEEGNIWLINDNAIPEYFDQSNFTFLKCNTEPQNPDNYVNAGGLNTFLADHSGVLWFGTWLGGINIFNPSKSFFKNWELSSNSKEVTGKDVSSICEDKKNNLAVITGEGTVYIYNKSRSDREKYNFLGTKLREQAYFNFPRAIFDENGDLWIGDIGPRLFKLNRITKSFKEYTIRSPIQNVISIQNRVQWIIEEDDDKLLIGILEGVIELYKRTGSSSLFQMGFKDLNAYRIIGGAIKDQKNRILFSTNHKGLYEFLPEKKKFIKPVEEIFGAMKIYEDKLGNLWFGTFTNGLGLINKEKEISKCYTMNDGLPSNQIRNMIEDDEGNLWLLTPNGVSKFNPEKESFKNFGIEDGLKSKQYNSIHKSTNGEIFLGSSNGLVSFYPRQTNDNVIPPKVVITNISLFNRTDDSLTFDKSISDLKEIKLPYNQNDLYFEFVALHYVKPPKNLYSVMLENFDDNWTKPGTMRSVTYTNLSPGEYTFKVKAANSDGIWNEEGTSIKIIILPPWWATTWAYILYTILILSLIYFTWKLQVKRVRNKHELEMSRFEAQKLYEVDEIKTRFFTNISHEFRTPLTLILGPAKRILERSKDIDSKTDADFIYRSAKKLNRLVDELLDISKIESGEMKLKTCPVNLIPIVKESAFSFSSLADRKKITFKVSNDLEEIVAYIDKEKFDKILSNVLANAFKFTPEGGKVEIGITMKEKNAEINISDTGTGIPKNQIDKIFDRFYQVDGSHTRRHEGTGIGLALTKELIELHGGKIEVASEEGKGSKFKLIFPLGKDHLKPEEICEEETNQYIQKENIFPGLEEAAGSWDGNKDDFESSDKPVLLIVEDNPDVRKYVSMTLWNDYNICEANDGEEGLEKSFESIPDLIISDIMMPKLDGFTMCKKLKTDTRTSHIPIIILTAKATMNDKLNGLEIGADDYIMKPFEAEELKARIKNLLEQRKRLHEHFRRYGLVEVEDKKITSVDRKFIQQAVEIINKNISDTFFGVEKLADDMAISKSLLFKKTSSLIGIPPIELIKRTRLNKAAKLIEDNSGNISEIALEVGFNNPSYFAECFKKQFGVSPSQYHNRPNNT